MKLSEMMDEEAYKASLTRQGCIDSSIIGRWADDVATLEAKLEALEGAIALIAEDALWHDGSDNPEALEDIRKTVKALGYTRAKILAAANE